MHNETSGGDVHVTHRAERANVGESGRMNGLCSRDPRRFFSRLEQLESRVLMAAAPPV